MNKALAGACLAVMFGGELAGTAVAQQRIGMMVLSFAGERNWSVECSAEKVNGRMEEYSRDGRGRHSSGSVTFRRVIGGNCTLEVPEGASLKVDIRGGRSVVCPFDEANPCSRTFFAGTSRFAFAASD